MQADDLKNLSWVEFFNVGFFPRTDNPELFARFEAEYNRRIEAMASGDEYERLRFDVSLASIGKTREDLDKDLFDASQD